MFLEIIKIIRNFFFDKFKKYETGSDEGVWWIVPGSKKFGLSPIWLVVGKKRKGIWNKLILRTMCPPVGGRSCIFQPHLWEDMYLNWIHGQILPSIQYKVLDWMIFQSHPINLDIFYKKTNLLWGCPEICRKEV